MQTRTMRLAFGLNAIGVFETAPDLLMIGIKQICMNRLDAVLFVNNLTCAVLLDVKRRPHH
jgi:hypothetical protein